MTYTRIYVTREELKMRIIDKSYEDYHASFKPEKMTYNLIASLNDLISQEISFQLRTKDRIRILSKLSIRNENRYKAYKELAESENKITWSCIAVKHYHDLLEHLISETKC